MALVKYNNNSIRAVTSASSIPSGAMTLIKTLTASSSGTLSFVNGSSDVVFDATYPIYKFNFINMHPETADRELVFQGTTDGSNFNVTMTSTYFYADHTESDSSTALGYSASSDLAQSTSAQKLAGNIGNDNDQSASGELWLFAPSDTTYVKHFFGKANEVQADDRISNVHYAGYCNVTSAIDGVQFSISAGTIDTGTFKLYGVS